MTQETSSVDALNSNKATESGETIKRAVKKIENIRKILISTSSLLLFIFLLVYLTSLAFGFGTAEFFKFSVLAIYLYCIFTFSRLFTWSHSIMLFYLAFGLFLLSRVFLDVFFNVADIYIADKLTYYQIQPGTVSIVLFSFIISLLSVHLGVLIALKHRNFLSSYTIDLPPILNNKARYILIMLIVASLPGTLLKLWHDYNQIASSGYLIAFSSERIPAPFFFRLSWFLLKSIAPVLVVFVRKKKHLAGFILVMLLIDLANIAAGNRSSLIAPVAFFFWFYYKFLVKKAPSILRISIIGIIVIVFSIVSINLREKTEIMKFNLLDYAEAFFYSQGVSYLLNIYYQDYNDKLENPSHFAAFHPISNYFIRGDIEVGHSEEYVERTLSLDHKITYAVSPNGYLMGQGLGTSYIIELIALGGWIILGIGSLMIGYLIIKLEDFFIINTDYRFLSWFWIYHLVSLPRSGLIPDLVPILLCFVFIKLLKSISNSRRRTPNVLVAKFDN